MLNESVEVGASGSGSSRGARIRTAPISVASINAEKIGCEKISTERIGADRISTARLSTPKISARPIVTLPTIPHTMRAAVYLGVNDVRVQTVPTPLNADGTIGAGEVLVRIDTCGICGTDLKKIHSGSHSAPRIFGHEMAGTIAMVGDAVAGFEVGDRVMAYHHIPCGKCYYCRKHTFAQCETYKKVGCTAGFAPAGGGFAEYIRVMDWIVAAGGLVRIPDDIPFEQASFIEPVNTCFKAVRLLGLQPDETVLVMGQGPIGILLAGLARRTGATVLTSDLYPERHAIAAKFGLNRPLDARSDVVAAAKGATEGRGADVALVAVGADALIRTAMNAIRPGGAGNAVCVDPTWRGAVRSGGGVHGREDADGFVLGSGDDQRTGYRAGFRRLSRWELRSDAADLASISAGGSGEGDRSGVTSAGGLDEDCD